MGYRQNGNDPDHENHQSDELPEDELEEVAGGLATVSIARCSVCHVGIAVYGMNVCTVCFRKTQIPLEGEGS